MAQEDQQDEQIKTTKEKELLKMTAIVAILKQDCATAFKQNKITMTQFKIQYKHLNELEKDGRKLINSGKNIVLHWLFENRINLTIFSWKEI